MVFTPYVSSQLDIANRVDVIWDVYKPDSLKMRVDDTKTELFRFNKGGCSHIRNFENECVVLRC